MKYTEEEKKAIEFFEKRQKYMGDYRGPLEENTDIVLNLIEKQQKEIERLRYGRNFLSEHITAQIATPELFDKIVEENYVPKEAIREKIEYYKKQNNELDDFTCEIDALEELLGE